MAPCSSWLPTTASPSAKRLNASIRTPRDARLALSRKPGQLCAVAFSRTGDPATVDFSVATVIGKFGAVPEDLSTLCTAASLSMLTQTVRTRDVE